MAAVHTGAAGYEYTPGDGSEAEKRDKERQNQKVYTGSKLDSAKTTGGTGNATHTTKMDSSSGTYRGGAASTGGGRTSPGSTGYSASAAAAASGGGGSSGAGGSGGAYWNGKTVKVSSDGKAQPGLSVGTDVVTGGGTYRIDSVNADGTYNSTKVNNTTTANYTGKYDSPGGTGSASGPPAAWKNPS